MTTTVTFHRKIVKKDSTPNFWMIWFEDGQLLLLPKEEVPDLAWQTDYKIKFTLTWSFQK